MADGMPLEQIAAASALDEYQKLHMQGVRSSAPVLEVGDPAAAILATSRSREADLVVMGTNGRRGVSRVLLGSVAERVIDQSEIPVLTVRGARFFGDHRYAKVLSPVNYTAAAKLGLRWAILFASVFESQLIVLHLVDEGSNLEAEFHRLREWVGDFPMPASARLLVRRGEASQQIEEWASRNDVDLIALGAQRKPHARLGATAHGLIRRAKCPVLTIPVPQPALSSAA
jgi:nucleotide-binding universal stress UspA family protein